MIIANSAMSLKTTAIPKKRRKMRMVRRKMRRMTKTKMRRMKTKIAGVSSPGPRSIRKKKKSAGKAAAAITRKLANNKEYIDCDQCSAYECYVDEDDMDDGQQRRDELDEEVSNWIEELAECQETGQQWNGLDLYTGVMCSPYGDGVELAVFANEDCTWYTNQAGFQDVYDPYADDDEGGNINYIMYAEEFIKAAFSEVTPCLQKEYANPEEDEEENEDEDDEEQEYQVNDYCQGIMEEDVVSFNACEAEEEEEEEENDDGNNYDWYNYDMKEADDVEQVCAKLNEIDSADYSHVYDEAASGTWYKRNKKGAIVYKTDEKEGLSGGAIAGIIAIVYKTDEKEGLSGGAIAG